MEEIFTAISREAGIMKLEVLKEATSSLMVALRRTEVESTSPGFEISIKCFQILKIALESGSQRLCSQALIGFQILLSQRIEFLDENLPKLILEAVARTPKVEEDTYISIMKIILTIWNNFNVELSFTIIRAMIDQCCISFTESQVELSRAAAQATLSHILVNICDIFNNSINSKLIHVSRKYDLANFRKDDIRELPSSYVGYTLVLTSKMAAIINHLSDNIDIFHHKNNFRYIEITLCCLNTLVENIPSLLCRKQDILSIIEKKMIRNLKAMLCESSLNFAISDCNYILNQESNIFSLAIKLMYSISTHIEFNKSIRFDFIEIMTNILKIDNSAIKNRKLEFIKDIFESYFAFSNLFFITNQSSGDLDDFSIDHENIIKILDYLRLISIDTKFCSEKILIHKSIIMLILTLDEIIIDDGIHKVKINNSCPFHQMNPQNEFLESFLKKSIKNGPILNLPTFKIFKVDSHKNQFLHRIKNSKSNELQISELITPNIVPKSTKLNKKFLSNSEPYLHKHILKKISSSKSCIYLVNKTKTKKVEEVKNRSVEPIVLQKKEIQQKKSTPIKPKDIKFDRNLRLRIPPKNINPNRNISSPKLPLPKNKNDKIKKEDISNILVSKFFEELSNFFRKLIVKNHKSLVCVDHKFHKFAHNFLDKIIEQNSKSNIKSFIDLYAEDVYYCSIFIVALSNHIENLATFNFEEFYESNFYQVTINNKLIMDFKKNIVKQLIQSHTFLVGYRIPDECKMLKNFIHQTATLIFPNKYLKLPNNHCEKNKIDESILEFLNKMYTDLFTDPSIKIESSDEVWEWESDIRLELMCLVSLLAVKLELWNIYDNLSKFITEMSLIKDTIDQRISISKTAGIQTIVTTSWVLINTCCQKSASWDNTFIIFSEILKLRENELNSSNLLNAVDSGTIEMCNLDKISTGHSKDFSNSSEKFEESFLSSKNTKDVIKYMYIYVEDFFKAVKSNDVLKDTADILSHLYCQAQKESNQNTVSLSSEFLFDCYINIIMEIIDIKFHNEIFIKCISDEAINSLIKLTLLDYSYDQNIKSTSLYDFLISYMPLNSSKFSSFVSNNYLMNIVVRKLIEYQKDQTNILIDLLVEIIKEKSNILGSAFHSVMNFILEIIKMNQNTNNIEILFEKIKVIINMIPSVIKDWIFAVPEIIINSLYLIDYMIDLKKEYVINGKTTTFDSLVFDVQNMIGVLIDLYLVKLIKNWKIIKFHFKKRFVGDGQHIDKLTLAENNEYIEDQRYFRLINGDDSSKDIKGFYEIFLLIITILQESYLKNIKSSFSHEFIILYDKMINIVEFKNIYYIQISVQGFNFLKNIFCEIQTQKCFDEPLTSVKQLSFMFSDFLALIFNKKQDDNFEYTDLITEMIEKYLNIFSLLSTFEDEAYSKLGCSCFRHIVKKFCEFSAGDKFLANMSVWQIIIKLLCQNIDISLKNFQNLVSCFSPSSVNVQGDIFRIKLIEKDAEDSKNCKESSDYILNSARQIFQTDDQIQDERDINLDININFIIVGINLVFQSGNVNNQELFRFETSKMLNELTVNQVMLELTDFVMNYMLNEVINIFYKPKPPLETKKKSVREIMYGNSSKNNSHRTINPATQSDIIEFLKELKHFFSPLRAQWELGLSLESRPGLKFILQRIYGLKYPANLIKLSTTSFSSFLTFLLRLCCFDVSLTSSNIKYTKLEPQKISPVSKNSINTKESIIKSPPINNRSQIKLPVNNSRSNIQELKNMFCLLCDIIEALQGDFVKSIDGNDSEMKYSDNDVWRNNLAALQNLSNMDLSKEGETWKTTIGNENDWILEKNRQIVSWIAVLRNLLEFLLQQSNPQFKVILPAVFKPLSSLIAAARDPKSQKMLSEVIMKCGVVYGIV